MKYKVLVRKTTKTSTMIEVDADSRTEAAENAWDIVLNQDDIKWEFLGDDYEFIPSPINKDDEDRCEHGMFFSGAGACPACGQ